MNKFICAGTIVVNKNTNKLGTVVLVDKERRIAVMRRGTGFWTDNTKNLKVVSYKEVL